MKYNKELLINKNDTLTKMTSYSFGGTTKGRMV